MVLRVEKRGGARALICSCCNLPFAQVQFGRLVIESKHYSAKHTNAITIDDLKELVVMLEGDGIIEKVQERASA